MPSIIAPVMDSRRHRHYHYNTIVLVKVQLAKQHKTAKKTTKTQPLELYEVVSSQGMIPSPGMHHVMMCDLGRSHRELGHTSSRVRKENEAEDNSDEY
jgi:hypothetical protein